MDREARNAAFEEFMDDIEAHPSAYLFIKITENDVTRVSTEQLKHFLFKRNGLGGLNRTV